MVDYVSGDGLSGKFLKKQLILKRLGRAPGKALDAMTDYGLNDREIGRYFRVTPSSVRRLKRVLLRRWPPLDQTFLG